MRKELTRTKQALSNESIQRIIDTTAYGVLSLNGDDGYLYTVPLSTYIRVGPFISTGRREDISPSASREPTKQAFRSSGKAKSFRRPSELIFKAFSFGDDYIPSPIPQRNSALFVRLLKSTAPASPIMKRKFSMP